MFIVLNDQVVPASEAKLHVSDLAIQRGYGIFDFLKVVDGHPYFLNDYLDRFYHSASIMRLAVPLHREEIIRAVYTLIEKNNIPSSGIKLILTGGYSPDGYQPAKPNLIISQSALTLPSQDTIDKGINIITHEYVRDIPDAKTINYSMGIWLIEKVNQSQAADVLYVKDSIVSEFPRSNFFIVSKAGEVLTPARNVLRGVTRKNVLYLANGKECDITLSDVYNAAEAFVTSTTKRIIPIVKVNDRIIGTGRAGAYSQTLLARLIELEQLDRIK